MARPKTSSKIGAYGSLTTSTRTVFVSESSAQPVEDRGQSEPKGPAVDSDRRPGAERPSSPKKPRH